MSLFAPLFSCQFIADATGQVFFCSADVDLSLSHRGRLETIMKSFTPLLRCFGSAA
jgi:hypothetical protein